MTQKKTSQVWTTIIKPKSGWFDINFRELWQYRDLIFLFVRRDFVSVYKQTILGPIWFFIQPLFTTAIFTVVFSSFAGISTDGLPPVLFYMSGTVAWGYFADCVNKTSNTFIGNANLFGKVYFPRLAVPISIVISSLMSFALQFILFIGFMGYFALQGASLHPNIGMLLTPLFLLMMGGLGLGLGIIVSSLTTKYRDLRFLVAFGVQLFMYATPVVYPLSKVPPKYATLLMLNPMTAIIEGFRLSYLGTGTFSTHALLISFTIIVLILSAGMLLFSKVEKDFMDTI
jgi:lipopolysaccharide transport system permease protein